MRQLTHWRNTWRHTSPLNQISLKNCGIASSGVSQGCKLVHANYNRGINANRSRTLSHHLTIHHRYLYKRTRCIITIIATGMGCWSWVLGSEVGSSPNSNRPWTAQGNHKRYYRFGQISIRKGKVHRDPLGHVYSYVTASSNINRSNWD